MTGLCPAPTRQRGRDGATRTTAAAERTASTSPGAIRPCRIAATMPAGSCGRSRSISVSQRSRSARVWGAAARGMGALAQMGLEAVDERIGFGLDGHWAISCVACSPHRKGTAPDRSRCRPLSNAWLTNDVGALLARVRCAIGSGSTRHAIAATVSEPVVAMLHARCRDGVVSFRGAQHQRDRG